MNCLSLFSNIDWAATGAMIGGVGSLISTAILVLGHIYQTRKLRKVEDANTEKACRISLFDKRYEVYDLFSRFYRTCTEFFEKINAAYAKKELELSEEDVRDSLKETICSDYSNLEGIYTRRVYLHYFNKNDIEDFDKEKQKELFDKYILIDEKFMKDSLTKMKMAKFVFSESVSRIVEEFAQILLDKYSYRESKSEFDNHHLAETFINRICEVMKKIENQKIVERMEKEINISI